jgi:hypothetical protein
LLHSSFVNIYLGLKFQISLYLLLRMVQTAADVAAAKVLSVVVASGFKMV